MAPNVCELAPDHTKVHPMCAFTIAAKQATYRLADRLTYTHANRHKY